MSNVDLYEWVHQSWNAKSHIDLEMFLEVIIKQVVISWQLHVVKARQRAVWGTSDHFSGIFKLVIRVIIPHRNNRPVHAAKHTFTAENGANNPFNGVQADSATQSVLLHTTFITTVVGSLHWSQTVMLKVYNDPIQRSWHQTHGSNVCL